MPPAYEVLLLNTAIPQIQAAQSGDTYVVPRDIAFSTVANLANGTNLLPSLTFSSDTNTGIYREGADALGFTAGGGTNQMVLTSTGLGIGTSSPYSNAAYDSLTVGGSKRGILTLNNASGTNVCQMFVDSADVSNLYSTTGVVLGSSSGANLLTYNSSGNLGLGVTPSAWQANGKALEFSAGAIYSYLSGASGEFDYAYNAYFDGGWKYKASSSAASLYSIQPGVYKWFNAPSGNANDPITFTQAMTLDASGNLGVGETSPASRLHVTVSGTAEVARFETTTNNTPSVGIYSNGGIRGKLRASTAEMAVLSQGSIPLLLGVNDTEAARITSGGDLLVGTTGTLNTTNSGNYLGVGNDSYHGVGHYNSASGAPFTAYYYNSGSIGGITQNGTTGVLYNITSDYRLKDVVGAVTNAGARIDALKPVDYIWKADGSAARGFLAHEFQAVYPNSVTGTKDAVDEEGKPVYQNMQASTSEVIADLVAEIQSLRARVAQLEQGA